MILTVYLFLLAFYLLGTAGIYLTYRRKERQVARKAWIKHIAYFVIINIVYFSIVINPVVFHVLAAIIVVAGFYELFRLFRVSGFKYGNLFLVEILVLVALSAGFLVFSAMHKEMILFTFIIISLFDGFSQITGQLWGRRKLFPKISPNKTVEGLIGGMLVAVLSSLIFTNLISATWLKTVLLAAWIAVFAFLGDTAKSIVKRKYNVKDFSNLIPGHGGFLDRFDSLIAAGAGVALMGWIVEL